MSTQYFRSYLLPCVSAALLVLTSPMFNLWQLMVVALVPYFLFVLETTQLKRLIVGTLLFAVPYCLSEGAAFFHLAGTWWTMGSTIFGLPSMVAYPLGIFAIILSAASFYFVPIGMYWLVKRRVGFSPILFACAFAFADYLRAMVLFGGYTFGTMGYALIETTYVKHVAVLGSVFALTFVAVLSATTIAFVVSQLMKNNGSLIVRVRALFVPSRMRVELAVVAIFFVAVFAFGMVREVKGPALVSPLRVVVVASTIKTEMSINAESYWFYRGLLVKAIAKNPDLIVLPENVFPYFIIDEDTRDIVAHPIIVIEHAHDLLQDFLALSRANPTTTFVFPTHTQKEKLTYNSILFYKNGEIISTYHKRFPVPFTEYAPFGLKLSLFERISKGESMQTLLINDQQFDAAICSEIDHFPMRTHGAHFIISPSNDSALSGHEVVLMHDRNARMRALETGAYMFRSTRGGISSVIDPYGRSLGKLEQANDIILVDVK